jgi:diguanylate cyclase (GGDEF)-like protein
MIDSDNLKRSRLYGRRRQPPAAPPCGRDQAELRHRRRARYGGDGFIVLLPETPGKGAMEVAERIRMRIAETPLEVDQRRIVSSVSIGIACYPEDGRTLDSLAAHADRALYAAKQDGRNRSVRFRAAA